MTLEPLVPFGLRVRCPPGTRWEDIAADRIHAWVGEHRVVVFRGMASIPKGELPAAARRLGPLLPWAFGAINELQVDASKANYLYTPRAVPLHWDGAFVGTIPRYLFFQCIQAPPPGSGGETLFADTRRALAAADPGAVARWRAQDVRYETDRVVHYGGRFTQRVVAAHPLDGEEVIRYAEPVEDLNPVTVTPVGNADPDALRDALRGLLRHPDVLLAHSWRDGDVVVADNHVLLHGRRAFTNPAARHLQRINVLDPGRTWRHSLRDALRIRRPEFMVAEVPILLIATFLTVSDPAVLGTGVFWEMVVAFFLMFHFGDIVNCLADRDLDAVYKTKLSEAVYGLGVANVRAQLAATGLGVLVLAAHLAWQLDRWWLVALVAFGLLWGHQYSLPPLWLKGRGPWQVITLIAILFVGPMLFVGGVLGGWPSVELLVVACLYGVMQEGTILVNTAEDHPEDLEAGIRTTAVALGPRPTVALAWTMVALGGGGLLAWFGHTTTEPGAAYALGLFTGAWIWVLLDIGTLRWVLRRTSEQATDDLLKAWAQRMPLWITTLAWSVLLTAWMRLP